MAAAGGRMEFWALLCAALQEDAVHIKQAIAAEVGILMQYRACGRLLFVVGDTASHRRSALAMAVRRVLQAAAVGAL